MKVPNFPSDAEPTFLISIPCRDRSYSKRRPPPRMSLRSVATTCNAVAFQRFKSRPPPISYTQEAPEACTLSCSSSTVPLRNSGLGGRGT